MPLSSADFSAIWLTLQLASLTTLILLIVGTPIALWLSRTRSWLRGPIGAIVALPLVLPPTVIGFYLLLALGPNGYIGQLTQALGLGTLTFSFSGLVIGSVIYSMPFVVQPLQNAFTAIGTRPLEVAATLRANPWDTFFSVILPLARPGFITAAILGFAHTVGEFGVVLMIGGNIPEKPGWSRCRSTTTSKPWNTPRPTGWPLPCWCSRSWCCWRCTPAAKPALAGVES